MRWLAVLLLILATVIPVAAEDWTTADGKTYNNVTVVAQEDDGVRIKYDGGVGKIPYYELPLEIQKRFGQDPDSLEAKRQAAEKAQADASRNATEQQEQQDAAAAAAILQSEQKAQNAAAQAKASPAGAANGSATAGPSGAAKQAGVTGSQPGAGTAPASGASSGEVTESGGAAQAGRPATNVNPPPSTAPPTAAQPYVGSKLSYNQAQDISFLDSPTVYVYQDPPPTTPIPLGESTTLTMRVVSRGSQPVAPSVIEATFVSVSSSNKLGSNHRVVFFVDGDHLPVDEVEREDGGVSSNGSFVVESVSFNMSPAHVREIVNGKDVYFRVGNTNYRIDANGLALFRQYFGTVDQLAPPPSSLARTYMKFLARVPEIITAISTVCEYIILGGFALLVFASIAAFVMGISRFIKM